MTRRLWMLAVAMLSLTAAGVWAGLAPTNIRTTKAADCCLDPTCPPGCAEDCPPDCFTGARTTVRAKDVKTAGQKAVTKAVDCCLDPTCPPGRAEDCPPDCLNLTAKAKTTNCCGSVCPLCESEVKTPPRSTKPSVAKKYVCPPCPFCPGW